MRQPRRLCGACLPTGTDYALTRFGECDDCGLRTITAVDRRDLEMVRVPRSVPPASGRGRWTSRRWAS